MVNQRLTERGLQIGQLFGLSKFTLAGIDLMPDDAGAIRLRETEECEVFKKSVWSWLESDDSDTYLQQAQNLLECLAPQLNPDELH